MINNFIGYIAGCIGITPSTGFVDPTSSVCIGILCGICCRYGCKLKIIFNFDDSLDAFGIHFVSGVVGSILVGIFANDSINDNYGLIYGKPIQLLIQLYGISMTILWSAIGTSIIFYSMEKIIGLRVSKRSELVGLDQSEHGITLTAQVLNVAPLNRTLSKQNKLSYFINMMFNKLFHHDNDNNNIDIDNNID